MNSITRFYYKSKSIFRPQIDVRDVLITQIRNSQVVAEWKELDKMMSTLFFGQMVSFGSKEGELVDEIRNHPRYYRDLALFELSAMLLSRADGWMFESKHRRRIVMRLRGHIAAVFHVVTNYPMNYITELLDERLVVLGRLIQESADLMQVHYKVSQMMHGAARRGFIGKSTEEPIFADALVDYGVKKALLEFDKITLRVQKQTLDDWNAALMRDEYLNGSHYPDDCG